MVSKFERIPRWYIMAPRVAPRRLGISIGFHVDFWRDADWSLLKSIASQVQSQFGLKEFTAETCILGFNKLFELATIKDFRVFSAWLPKANKLSDVPCGKCGGSGWHGERKCENCESTGREALFDDAQLLPLCASISVLLAWLNTSKQTVSHGDVQLMRLELCPAGESFDVAGSFGQDLAALTGLCAERSELTKPVADSMRLAIKKIMGPGTLSSSYAQLVDVDIENFMPRLRIGSAALVVDPESGRFLSYNRGFSAANGSLWTALVQLFGLAALDQTMRKTVLTLAAANKI